MVHKHVCLTKSAKGAGEAGFCVGEEEVQKCQNGVCDLNLDLENKSKVRRSRVLVEKLTLT